MRPLPFLSAVILVAAVVLGVPAAAQTPPTRITLVHFNDTEQMNPRDGVGGVAEAMTIIRRLRADNPHTLLTFGGDMFSPSLMASFDHGAHMVALASAMGVDVAVLGNHEFDFGPAETKARLGESKFPWLGANVLENGQPMAGIAPSFIRDMGGYRLGFFGVVTERSGETTGMSALAFTNTREAARREAQALKAQGADIVIGLCHLPYQADIGTLHAVPEIDICLSGDDHIGLIFHDRKQLAVEAGANLQYLAVIDLYVSRERAGNREVVVWRPEARLVPTAGSPPDPEIAALVKGYNAQLDTSLNVPLGKAAGEFDSRHDLVRRQETSFGNLVADAMKAETGADVALANGGGLRADRRYPDGHVFSRRDILSELPFGNVMVVLRVTGAQLRETLENGVAFVENGAGRFPHVAGVAFDYDPKGKRGARIGSVAVNGKPLDAAATYTLATSDFIARGGDSYGMLAGVPRLVAEKDGKLLATVLMDHIAAQKTVTARIDGRVTAKSH